MLSPFLLLADWSEALASPQMPGIAALHALEHGDEWPPDCDGEPHPMTCTCPDCGDQEIPLD